LAKTLDNKCSLTKALETFQYELQPGFAVAVNQQFIPRSLYENTTIDANDCIEVVAPMQGG
jgi:sulfur carrier protein